MGLRSATRTRRTAASASPTSASSSASTTPRGKPRRRRPPPRHADGDGLRVPMEGARRPGADDDDDERCRMGWWVDGRRCFAAAVEEAPMTMRGILEETIDRSLFVSAFVWPQLAAALESDDYGHVLKPVTAEYLLGFRPWSKNSTAGNNVVSATTTIRAGTSIFASKI
ncbi:hypothetical protein HU200_058234 [Digitaria exilis]|uniref:Uncharacterized protein n=1 Tax=Digitaria exilis TaxID=1010633 RepID=A0A835AG17_9POAL|nr:hypothetical protein HU200_058234 [Digitaria exilis]